ncbi:hypothetical protein FRC03_001986 [Tulasnella sp. 419]|nr:hypothetical protein FRC03_001986 [Tulasnella sp. 419]
MEVIDLCDTTAEEDDIQYIVDDNIDFRGFSALDHGSEDSDEEFVLPDFGEIRSSQPQPSQVKTTRKRTAEPDVIDLEDSQPEEVPPPRKRGRKDPALTAGEKAEKAAQRKAEAERKKLEKENEKRLKAQQKEAEKAAKEAQKNADKAHNALNALVSSKGETLVDLTIQIPRALWDSETFKKIRETLEERLRNEYETASSKPAPVTWKPVAVKEFDEDARFGGIDNLITWKRHVYARYDEVNKQWEPVTPSWQVQGVYLMYFNLMELLRIYNGSENELSRRLGVLRRVLGRHHQLFIMIEGFHSSTSNSNFKRGEKPKLEQLFVKLQLEHNCFIVHSPAKDSTVNWLCNLTGDIGRKPYKLIESSHLPFYSQKDGVPKIEGGDHKSTLGTYQNMLYQINSVKEPLIRNMTSKRFPTLRSLFEAYQDPTKPEREKESLLIGIPMNPASRARAVTVGRVISSRVYSVFTADNGLNLVGGK